MPNLEDIQVLKMAVCIFPNVTTLDFQGPLEQFGYLIPSRLQNNHYNPELNVPKYALDITYVSPTEELVYPMAGAPMKGSTTYDKVLAADPPEQFNILLVPGGFGIRPNVIPPSLLKFVAHQAPGADYVLSVCTGAWVLAQAGVLGGKRATTNKAVFKVAKAATEGQNITWIPKARWVVDGNFWTSSGVTAGIDMTGAFMEHLVGEDFARKVRNRLEVSVRKQDDDEFAEVYGLV
ncbi:hypothetical protein EIP91_006388 [Steccherinum ochraceum]|uniref:DJ-1/PfpI domain-containing protein n=1 Tax=Steccherinum ochraceum TaxID=92696 RepID=A0A4R0RBL2_9APHY|nr:hypothetical protein EIP91_006388 [Steccherinum ochraceum]